MAWQAIVDQVFRDSEATVIRMIYTDGSQKIGKEYRLTSFDLSSFKQAVQGQIDQLTATDVSKVNIPLGPFDTTIPTLPPTPEDLFIKELIRLRDYQSAIDLKVLLADDPAYLAQLSKVRQMFDPSFIGIF